MKQEIKDFIAKNQDWSVKENFLVATFEFEDFSAVQNVVNILMKLAEAQNHHPDITFTYNTVEVRTTTHDVGLKITEKDIMLASSISEVMRKLI